MNIGIWFRSKLESLDHVAKANQILDVIRRTIAYMKWLSKYQLMKQLYTSLVRPHLRHGDVIWHPYLRKDIDMIEGVQQKAAKIVPR